MTYKSHSIVAGAFALISVFTLVGVTRGFFDEIESLRQELQVWETTHAADFSDVIAQLDDMTGSVFQDVPEEAWFAVYVSSLADWGIVSGYRDVAGYATGEYRPGNPVTVAEILKMAMESADIDETQCQAPTGHKQAATHWSRQYVSCAEAIGMRMFSTGLDIPLDRSARRAEVIAIVHDAFNENVLPIYSNFRDTAGHEYESDIAYATINGVVGGDTDSQGNPTGTFRPDSFINRAEAAKVIYEELKLIAARTANI